MLNLYFKKMGKLKTKLFLKLPVNCVRIRTRKSEFKIMVYHLVIVAAMPGMIWYAPTTHTVLSCDTHRFIIHDLLSFFNHVFVVLCFAGICGLSIYAGCWCGSIPAPVFYFGFLQGPVAAFMLPVGL